MTRFLMFNLAQIFTVDLINQDKLFLKLKFKIQFQNSVQDCDKVESNSIFTSKTKPFTKIYYTLQSKHPHIIYESIEKPRQLCGVSDSVLRNPNSRSRRSVDDIHDMFHSHNDNNNHSRHQRDVRYVPKFVETALVLDKAMV